MGKKSVRNRRKKILIATAAVFVILFAAISGIWAYKTITVAQLRSLAYEFIPDSSWTKVGEYSAEPEIITCLDSACPMYEITWNTNGQVTPQKIQQRIEASGWKKTSIEGSCELDSPRFGGHNTACHTQLTKGGDTISISYSNDSQDYSFTQLSLRITR